MESSVQLHRVEYAQVGLCSTGCLQAAQLPTGQLLVVVGEQSGSVSGFVVRSNELNKATGVFRTLAVGQSPVSSIQLIVPEHRSATSTSSFSLKILAAYENAFVRSFNRRGKEFFSVELSHLTEPIRHFRLRWPSELFVAGLHTFTQYVFGSNEFSSSVSGDQAASSSRIQSGIRFVCPAQITGFLVLNRRIRRKLVTILACEDRLLRVLFDSNCETELETCGIVSCILKLKAGDTSNAFVCYGTLDGRISLIRIDFGASQVQATHCWELRLPRSRAPVLCLCVNDQLDDSGADPSASDSESIIAEEIEVNASELGVGRADGSIELFSFEFGVKPSDQVEFVDVTVLPRLCATFKAGESIAGLQICAQGQVIIAVTFTGCLFALLRWEAIEGDLTDRIEELEAECDTLEAKLIRERTRYQEESMPTTNSRSMGALFDSQSQKFALRALPGFQLNESFVLQEDASYLLTLECEVAIDCVFVQSDIPLDLMDCERNSAVVSFNDSQNESVALDSTGETASDAAASNGEILATFRCQADTRQLQIRVCTIEGHFGLITVYVISRLTPKVCLVRQFHVKALSLHKRKYFDSRSKAKQLNTFSRSDQESDTTSRPEMASNQLVLIGSFSLSEAHSWLCNALPEVPDKLTTTGGVEYTYECTLTGSILRIQLTKGRLAVHSNSVSSVSILKEFCTREATRKGIAIELRLQLSEASLKVCLAGVHKRLCPLIQHKQTIKLQEAINELIVGEPESVQKMISELKLVRHLDEGSNVEDIGAPADSGTTEWQSSELDRLYGLIADLYIDYQKLNGVVSRTFIQSVRSRVGEMIALIEKSVSRDEDFDTFVCKLNAFWGFPTN